VPWNIAFQLEDYEVLALVVILGEQSGGQFSWQTMKWIERN
jgi:hypothetical protein